MYTCRFVCRELLPVFLVSFSHIYFRRCNIFLVILVTYSCIDDLDKDENDVDDVRRHYDRGRSRHASQEARDSASEEDVDMGHVSIIQ